MQKREKVAEKKKTAKRKGSPRLKLSSEQKRETLEPLIPCACPGEVQVKLRKAAEASCAQLDSIGNVSFRPHGCLDNRLSGS
jgi:hypothetical protein